ncbi:hypothetical protein INT43_007365 [Umbelopsis isabellina]|uniref:Adenine DNA glycosylase n=1 Tax=Mortierella isabellina TaxID=91625 RepID=A0A8H7UGR0_MORIS|nr:hypothetical protein INT43_007365 [Umbelopsis isabellina]
MLIFFRVSLEPRFTCCLDHCMTSPKITRHLASYHKFSEKERQQVQEELLKWFDVSKRTHLPWRKEWDGTLDTEQRAQRAYEVWVSEIMLQQTQVATTIPYYDKWMQNFPTIHDLAKADIEKVNKLWAGLGYYSRARRLWEGAKKMCEESNGVLPSTAKELEDKVPGVGRYTAGAIASIAWGQQAGTVDGNIARVYSRMRAIGGDAKGKSTIELQWKIADYMVPEGRPGDFNQALMELGATVCTPQKPDCKHCPVQKSCLALKEVKVTHSMMKDEPVETSTDDIDIEECNVCLPNNPDEELSVTRYPRKAIKKAPREEECAVCILEKRLSASEDPSTSRFLLIRRPKTGLLAGLWEFPSAELNETLATKKKSVKKRKPVIADSEDSGDDYSTGKEAKPAAAQILANNYKERTSIVDKHLEKRFKINMSECNVIRRAELGSVIHLFSHIRKTYHMEHLVIHAESLDDLSLSEDMQWVSRDELNTAAIPTGLKKGIKLMESQGTAKSIGVKSNPRKKAKMEQDPAAGTRGIMSFFQKQT